MKLIPEIVAREKDLIEIRRDIHAHPELAFEEHRTSELVATKLAAWGIEVHRGLGGTGVVGIVRNGSSARMIGLRADMDALPVAELNTFEYRSRHAGRMHACGHDGHTTMLLGAAEYLASTRNFNGTVVLVFQPAEEGHGGAAAMIADGFFERFPVQSIYGMHNWPGMPVGCFGISPGPSMASADRFDILVSGKGAHAAMPHQGTDVVLAGAQLISSLQRIAARSVDPLDAVVVSVTEFHAGDAYNVMPEKAELCGTVRALNTTTREAVLARMQRVCDGIAAAHEVEINLAWRNGSYPPTINTPAEAELCREQARGLVGDANIVWNPPPSMGAEDFSFFLQRRPGCYVWLGNGSGQGGCLLHNPGYDFNDKVLSLGASYWVRLAEALLAKA